MTTNITRKLIDGRLYGVERNPAWPSSGQREWTISVTIEGQPGRLFVVDRSWSARDEAEREARRMNKALSTENQI